MKVLVCGSRDWTDSGEIAFHLALIFGTDPDRLVIHGNCGDLNHRERGKRVPTGADVLAGWCAAGVGAGVNVYPHAPPQYEASGGQMVSWHDNAYAVALRSLARKL